jgi:hypothetical protein
MAGLGPDIHVLSTLDWFPEKRYEAALTERGYSRTPGPDKNRRFLSTAIDCRKAENELDLLDEPYCISAS